MITELFKDAICAKLEPMNSVSSYKELDHEYNAATHNLQESLDRISKDKRSFTEDEVTELKEYMSSALQKAYDTNLERVRTLIRQNWVF